MGKFFEAPASLDGSPDQPDRQSDGNAENQGGHEHPFVHRYFLSTDDTPWLHGLFHLSFANSLRTISMSGLTVCPLKSNRQPAAANNSSNGREPPRASPR